MNACPKKAIHMEPDRQGFLYPVINTVKYGEMRRLRIMQTELPNWKSKSSAE